MRKKKTNVWQRIAIVNFVYSYPAIDRVQLSILVDCSIQSIDKWVKDPQTYCNPKPQEVRHQERIPEFVRKNSVLNVLNSISH